MFCVWDLVVEGEGFKRESIVTVGERGEEFRLSGIRDIKGGDSFKKELWVNCVECSLDIMRYVD